MNSNEETITFMISTSALQFCDSDLCLGGSHASLTQTIAMMLMGPQSCQGMEFVEDLHKVKALKGGNPRTHPIYERL